MSTMNNPNIIPMPAHLLSLKATPDCSTVNSSLGNWFHLNPGQHILHPTPTALQVLACQCLLFMLCPTESCGLRASYQALSLELLPDSRVGNQKVCPARGELVLNFFFSFFFCICFVNCSSSGRLTFQFKIIFSLN